MADSGTRDFSALVQATGAHISPVQASAEQMLELSGTNAMLTVYAVEAKDNEEYGTIYEYDVSTLNGPRLVFGLWANPQRDQTAITLMQLCADGPVTGVRLQNNGTAKNPFYVLVPA